MGYLNYNLEKKALDLSQLSRMTANAVNRGKLPHFLKRLAQRNAAVRNVSRARQLKFDNATKGSWNHPEKVLAAQPLAQRIPGHGTRMGLKYIYPGSTAGTLTAKDVIALGHHGGISKMPPIRHADVGMQMIKSPYETVLGYNRLNRPIIGTKFRNTLYHMS